MRKAQQEAIRIGDCERHIEIDRNEGLINENESVSRRLAIAGFKSGFISITWLEMVFSER